MLFSKIKKEKQMRSKQKTNLKKTLKISKPEMATNLFIGT